MNYLLAAAAAGSSTQAAVELGVSQPTSEQIRKLEQGVGVAVFTRAKQGLTLTEAWHRFLPHARRVARDYRDAMDSVSGIRNMQEGTVASGMFNSSQYVLSGLPAFRSLYPYPCSLRRANSAQIADRVRSGRLEAGVVALPIDARGLTISDVLRSCEAAYFHTKPAVTSPVTIEGLLERPLALPESGWTESDPARRQLSERAQTLGIPFTLPACRP
ncbi:LysR family transcriptional regulator [Arthrobacter sp. NQ7]|uniref:LysR family transcriptional regulator n=1 Tax=Arthrobacter sp. NQ7 TaxID=3032303 RepID=UPI00240F5A6E|nr:LysR family transcriptional regulator [Arthrobacter sp. NQ7]MDJ0459838.1 LysR family transcriptional regulator [Arthrobacter sp. NQ7]